MRFARILSNALLAGGLTAAYLTVLVLQLNPHVPLLSGTAVRWFLTFAATYGLGFAGVCFVLVVTRAFFSMDRLSPGWASVRVLAWLSAAAAAAASLLMWLNVNALGSGLDEAAAHRMAAGATATTVSALALFGIAVAHYGSGRQGSRVGGALFTLAAAGSLALPLAARGPAVARPEPLRWPAAAPPDAESAAGPRVFMLLLDGASLEYIRTRSTEGRFPNFSKVLESGASMYLATVRPTQPGPVWAAAATGTYPAKNGVRSAAEYLARGDGRPLHVLPDYCFSHLLVRLGVVRVEPNTSAAWRARPLWSILSSAGIPSAVVRWPLVYPVRPVLGFTIDERFFDPSGASGGIDERAAHPPEMLPVLRGAVEAPAAGGAAPPAEDAALASAARRDRLFGRAAHDLQARAPVRVLALRFQTLDAAGHRYYDDAEPSAFRDGTDAERRARQQKLERAYAAVDGEVGRLVDAMGAGDLLLVVSGFGMQRLHPAKELLARALGDPVARGTHERAPDGFLLALGDAVDPGRLPRGSIVDVAPTVLYFLGLPVGRDMDGFARTDLFRAEFTEERPIAFIASHNR